MPIKVNTFGGDPSFADVLKVLDLENPEVNGESYDNWASSVKDFPDVIDKKVLTAITGCRLDWGSKKAL